MVLRSVDTSVDLAVKIERPPILRVPLKEITYLCGAIYVLDVVMCCRQTNLHVLRWRSSVPHTPFGPATVFCQIWN